MSKIENVTIQRYQSNDISNDFIWDIIERHRHFHDTKGLKNEDRDVLMNRYSSLVETGNLEISICLVGDSPMVFHVYIIDGDLVALNMSFSDFREHIDSAKIYGNLNRYLHWEDMKYFKSKGLKSYDWGGTTIQIHVWRMSPNLRLVLVALRKEDLKDLQRVVLRDMFISNYEK